MVLSTQIGSNNTNKLSPQEQTRGYIGFYEGSNNTNKLSPQERSILTCISCLCSNNTNKLSPQEPPCMTTSGNTVQIIQINLVLKNT